jgi:serine/threonine protein kinase
VLLTDFGVARLAMDQQSGGTPPYMAPEQFLGHEVDAPTDVYGLGITVYEALSGGKVPFRGDSPNSHGTTVRDRIKWEHCNMPLPPLRKFNSTLPTAIIQVVERALSKDPNQRFPSVMALKEDYEQARAYSPQQDDTLYKTIQFQQPLPKPQPVIEPAPPSPPVIREYQAVKGPHLLCQAGEWRGQVIPLEKGDLTIGRSTDSQLRLRERSISRTHATMIRTRRGVYIRDENSMTGTYVNGKRITGPFPLKHGDAIQIGYYQEFQFRER